MTFIINFIIIIFMEIKKELLKKRVEKGMSLNQLAKTAGLTPPAVSYLERGVNKGTRASWIKIAKALDLEWDYFLN